MKKTVNEIFPSINSLIKAIDSREQNPAITKKSSETGSKNFTGTADYTEAKNLLINGCAEVLPELRNIKPITCKAFARQQTLSIRGYAPHVPNAIIGLPNSMIASKKIPQKAKTLDITYSTTVNCYVKAAQLIKAGKLILAAIKKLESSGTRVKFTCLFIATHEKDAPPLIGGVILKSYHASLNIKKLAFPMIHPSFLRRIGFKWLETIPQPISKAYNRGYGKPLCKGKIAELIPGKIITAQEIINSNFDAEALLKQLES